MKTILFLTTLFLLSCETKNKNTLEETKRTEIMEPKTEKLNIVKNSENPKNSNDWQEGFGLTHDIDKDSVWKKPVRYYIENKNCSQAAIDFYFGKYRPADEPKTEDLLSLVTTENLELRPFYRWILNKTILIQDGALGEYTGKPAREYAEKFPNEFFEYMDIDKSGEKYVNWYNSIMYSGFYDGDNFENPNQVRQNMEKTMSENCRNCNQVTVARIKKLAHDCFPGAEKEPK